MSSTVPQLEPEWLAMASRYLGHEMLAVGPGLKTGMAIRIDNPRELGADRLVNAVAAYDQLRRRRASASTSAPRSTTTSCRAGGEYLGGVIAPGVEVSLDALTEARRQAAEDRPGRAALGDRQVDRRRDPLGRGLRLSPARSTGSCARLQDELGEECSIIATGGLASHIVPHTEMIDEIDDLLTLTGLKLLHEYNQGS